MNLNLNGRVQVALNIGIALIDRIEMIHKANYVHNDIKLDNIVIGDSGQERKQLGRLRIIDFGTATKFMKNGNHVKESTYHKFEGNIFLNSAHVLANKPPSRRDDMISIGLLMIFLVDELPY